MLVRHRSRGEAPYDGHVQAAFFDLDKTVIAKASMAAFRRPLRRGGLLTRRVVLRAVVTHLVYLHLGADERRMGRIRDAVLALTKGWNKNVVRQIVRDTLLETVEPIIYAEALELLQHHRAMGHRIYLVSASPEEMVEPLAELLGADGAIASRADVDAEGYYTGRMAFYASGPNKAAAIRELATRYDFDLPGSAAYSDSMTDVPMLETVGHPVAVNPDRGLARLARERGWEIRAFTKPVRLRNRMSLRMPIATALLATAAAALAWRHGRRRHRRESRAALRPA